VFLSAVIFGKVVRIFRFIQVIGVVCRFTWVINVFYGCNTYLVLSVIIITSAISVILMLLGLSELLELALWGCEGCFDIIVRLGVLGSFYCCQGYLVVLALFWSLRN
jgi:hypothetical protein